MKTCTLCGGKLDHTKRCTLCGLDNTKNDRMYRDMVNRNNCEHEPLTHVHTEPEKPAPKKVVVTPTKASAQVPGQMYKQAPKQMTNTNMNKKASGCLAVLFSLVPILIALIIFVTNIMDDAGIGSGIEEIFMDEEVVYPEGWEEGYYYERDLEPGIYEVGNHLPAGIYAIEAVEGYSGEFETCGNDSGRNAVIADEWNSYSAQWFLYEGEFLIVPLGSRLHMICENAQPTGNEYIVDEFGDTVKVEESMEIGSNVPAGSYTVEYHPSGDSEEAKVLYVIVEEGGYWFELCFFPDMGVQTFSNLPLPEGAYIAFDMESEDVGGEIYVYPSEWDFNVDYMEFYKSYY